MLSCLKEASVEFLIVGAYALAAHGLPRATGDIDILVRRDDVNARRVMQAIAKFGAPTSDLSEQDFTSPDMVVQFGVEPCRIDLLTRISGVEFDDAWRNRVKVEVDGLELYVLSKADLLKNKAAAGRDKDQSDIAWLMKQTSTNT
jgi:predicted nucleotidyltransferase